MWNKKHRWKSLLTCLSMNPTQLHALKKDLSLSNIKQKFHRIFKTSLSHCEAGNVFDLHVNVIMPVLKLSSCPANSFILLRVLSTGVFLKSFFSSLNWFSPIPPHLQETASRKRAATFPATQAHLFWEQRAPTAAVIKDAFGHQKQRQGRRRSQKSGLASSPLVQMLQWRCREQSHRRFWQPGHLPNTRNTDAKDKLKASREVWDRLCL